MLSSIEKNNEMFDLAKENNVLLMEAMKAVFLPINIKIKQMLDEKIIGNIVDIRASFIRGETFDPSHWINDVEAGGALKDVGSYCAGIMNYLIGKNPRILSRITNASENKSDTIANVEIDYEGIPGHLSAFNSLTGDTSLEITGTRGMIKVDNFWKTGVGYYLLVI